MPHNDESPTAGSRSWRATLGRALRLFNEFRYEQPDPARFYRAIAEDSVGQLSTYTSLDGSLLLDVGGGPGYFRDAFEASGATYFSLDADAGELAGMGGEIPERTVLGSGMELPFRDGSLDITYSSNVLEHVPEPWTMAQEMVRVTKPGGLVFISYTVWFGPWGGHETSPWHYLGGARAARRYRRKHGKQPKNLFGTSMYAVTVKDGIDWAARQHDGVVLDVIPRYNPRWSYWMLKIPLLREVVTWNLVVVLRKK